MARKTFVNVQASQEHEEAIFECREIEDSFTYIFIEKISECCRSLVEFLYEFILLVGVVLAC